MKKILIVLFALGFTTLLAGTFSWISNTRDKTLKSKAEQLEAYGQHSRVYEVYEFRKTFASGAVMECIVVSKYEGLGVWCHPLPSKKSSPNQ